MTYYIGQVLPIDRKRGLTGDPLDAPEWYALTVHGGKESAARDMLKANGIHAQYPVREVKYRQRGKAMIRKLPIITRVIYAQFCRQPQWDVLKARRLITGVYGIGETPLVIPYDVIRAVMGLPTVEEELEAARREMLRVRDGDKAEITTGPLAGFVVDVNRVADGVAWFTTVAGIKGTARIDTLERRMKL
jgi:transcription antitermination factor NusG